MGMDTGYSPVEPHRRGPEDSRQGTLRTEVLARFPLDGSDVFPSGGVMQIKLPRWQRLRGWTGEGVGDRMDVYV